MSGVTLTGEPNFQRLTIEQMEKLADESRRSVDRILGAKHDAGKIRAGVMFVDFPHALEAVAKVSTFGCQKYAPHSWTNVPDAEARYFDAFMRHLLAEAKGEIVDKESGLDHLAHVAWNALALLELHLRRAEAPTLP